MARYRYRGHIAEHVEVAEKALGHPLPSGAEVHHVNNDGRDNRGGNLVICQDKSYHQMLHRRARVIRAGYPASWVRCKYCLEYGPEDTMYHHTSSYSYRHRGCHTARERDRRENRNNT